jgi:DNA-binding protein HU-beta
MTARESQYSARIGRRGGFAWLYFADRTFGIERDESMSKTDFVEAVAKQGKISKADAKRAVEMVLGTMETGLKGVKNGGKYQIGTFGSFRVSKRAARTGRNPRTGEPIKIKASKSLRFKPSSQLKKAAGC